MDQLLADKGLCCPTTLTLLYCLTCCVVFRSRVFNSISISSLSRYLWIYGTMERFEVDMALFKSLSISSLQRVSRKIGAKEEELR